MQHLHDLGPARPPLPRASRPARACACVAQRQRRQRAQHELGVVGADAEADPHVRALDALVQRRVARRHRSHQHVAAARRVLGQRLDRDVDRDRRVARAGADRERIERESGAPGVVERDRHAALARDARPGRRGRGTPSSPSPAPRARPGACARRSPRRATPDPSDRRSDARCPSRRARGARSPCSGRRRCRGSAPRRRSSASAMSTSVIAARPLGTSTRLHAAFERRDALLERERRRRAVQAVGVAGLLLPAARAQRGGVGEDDVDALWTGGCTAAKPAGGW